MKYDAIMIKARDNVATALRDLTKSQECRFSGGDGSLTVITAENISRGLVYCNDQLKRVFQRSPQK